MNLLERKQIIDALGELSRRLGERGATGEVCLFGGAAMILAFRARQTTRDIDAIFAPTAMVRQLADEIARDRGYDAGWFNDGVIGFVSSRGKLTSANLPQFPNLRVMMPVPSYLLAMKCLAARAGTPDATDVRDVKFLLRRLNLREPQPVLDLVESYYPRKLIQPKTQYFIEAVLEQMEHEQPE